MNLEFTKNGDLYIAEFTAEADFNIHIEKDAGFVTLYQTSVAGGKYEVVRSLNRNYLDPVIDAAHKVLVAPLYIRLVSSTMPSVAVVTFRDNGGGGGGGCTEGEESVMFYDFNGDLLHSYTASEFLAMSAMPELPAQDGLVCQNWNYNLEDAKAYVENYGALVVGATYITDDGATRLYISIGAEGRMDVPISFTQSVANGVAVDWGDGSAPDTYGENVVSAVHTYASVGDYIISLTPLDGCEISISRIFPETALPTFSKMLYRVEMGVSVTNIGEYAFNGCSALRYITIPEGVASIGAYGFAENTGLSALVVPNGVVNINNNAAEKCSALTCVSLAASVANIGEYAFNECSALRNITIPEGVAILNQYSLNSCSSLRKIILPASVTQIGDYAFASCFSLSEIALPPQVTTIGASAFSKCYPLEVVSLPSTLTSIGASAFAHCYSLRSIAFPEGITSIADYTCRDCFSLENVELPEGVISIGKNAFTDCIFKSFNIPSSVTQIGGYAFSGSALESIVIPASVENLSGTHHFANCYSLKDVTFLASVAVVPQYCFSKCSALVNVSLPASITEIQGKTFEECSALTTLTLPMELTTIGSACFSGCASMKVYDFSNCVRVPSLYNGTIFNSNPADMQIIVPDALYDAWIDTTNWRTLASKTIKASEYTA